MLGADIDRKGVEALEVYARPIEDLPGDCQALEGLVPEYRSKNPFVRSSLGRDLESGLVLSR